MMDKAEVLATAVFKLLLAKGVITNDEFNRLMDSMKPGTLVEELLNVVDSIQLEESK